MTKQDFNARTIRKETDEKGTTRYYDTDGKLHRDDGPALIKSDSRSWYRHGQLHRADGPALEMTDGDAWYLNGELHRDSGPAIEIPSISDGRANEWWLHGKQLTADEFARSRPTIQSKSASTSLRFRP